MMNRAGKLTKKHDEKYEQASGHFGTQHSKLPGTEPRFTYDD
jgi:hypothetical protein